MKKYYLIGVMLLIALISSNCSKDEEPQFTKHNIYDNPILGMRLEMPQEWWVHEEAHHEKISTKWLNVQQNNYDVIVAFLFWTDREDTSEMEELIDEYLAHVIESNVSFNLIERSSMEVGGETAAYIVYDVRSLYEESDVRITRIFFDRDNRRYWLHFQCPPELYNESKKYFDGIIESIEFY
jgi:hypothetical protein